VSSGTHRVDVSHILPALVVHGDFKGWRVVRAFSKISAMFLPFRRRIHCRVPALEFSGQVNQKRMSRGAKSFRSSRLRLRRLKLMGYSWGLAGRVYSWQAPRWVHARRRRAG
jgi:hypothetical protein